MNSKRRLKRVPKAREHELRRQYLWLSGCYRKEPASSIKKLAVSVFDHWLSRDDACRLLENVSQAEQRRRDALLSSFCESMSRDTEVLSFAMRGRNKENCIFREFTSTAALTTYCTANGGRELGHRHFHVVLPEFGCAFFESWDDTYIFYFHSPAVETRVVEWAKNADVHVLRY